MCSDTAYALLHKAGAQNSRGPDHARNSAARVGARQSTLGDGRWTGLWCATKRNIRQTLEDRIAAFLRAAVASNLIPPAK